MARRYSRRSNNRSNFSPSTLIILAIGIVVVLFGIFRIAQYMGSESPDAQIAYSEKAQPAQQADADYGDLLYVINPEGIKPIMLSYTGFTVAFCPEKHQPYYTAWTLEPNKVDGPANRKDANFAADPNVAGCASLEDYRKSGFDRGHLCPAADCRWSNQAMHDCHYLTNISPQHTKLNTGAWKTIEENCRDWATKYGTLYIVAGPVLSDRLTRTIGASPVPVPDRFFKVIICPEADLGIGFIMPNEYVNGGAQATVSTIDQVEAITGFDFFSALPDDIENRLEQQHSLAAWNH